MRTKDEYKRLAIVEETLGIVHTSGIAGIKMASIAKRVGISVSTLYVYYDSKEKLIIGVHKEVIQRLSSLSREAIQQDVSYKLQLKSFWLFWVQLMIENTKEFSFLSQLKQSPYSTLCSHESRQINRKVAFEMFDAGKKEGLLKEIDNETLSYIMEALLLKTVGLLSQKEITMNQKEMDLWYSFFWDAIRK
jgi:AcrR family transcriptional regulator